VVGSAPRGAARPALARVLGGLLLPALLAAGLGGCRTFGKGERPPFRKVSPAVAFEVIRDSPDILILDLRPAEAFLGDTGHLRRAMNIPLDRLPYRLVEISPYRDDTFLVYCDAEACAEKGMSILVSSGFADAVLIDGGIDRWIAAGFRTVLPRDAVGRDGRDGGRGAREGRGFEDEDEDEVEIQRQPARPPAARRTAGDPP
jgi:rhodanese-related sulfurtransferase